MSEREFYHSPGPSDQPSLPWKEYARSLYAEREDLRHTIEGQAELLRDRREFVSTWAMSPDGTFIRRTKLQGELLSKTIAWVAAIILFALVVRQLFPRTETVERVVHLPSTTDTVEISTTEIRTVYDTTFSAPPEPEILIIADTIYLTRVDTVEAMPFTWYLTALQGGQSIDEPSYIYSVGLGYDGALTRAESLEQYPHSMGPVTHIRADSVGVHISWGEWPTEPKTCGTWCVTKWVLGGVAAGVIVGSVF